jgi:hypothetical protein
MTIYATAIRSAIEKAIVETGAVLSREDTDVTPALLYAWLFFYMLAHAHVAHRLAWLVAP